MNLHPKTFGESVHATPKVDHTFHSLNVQPPLVPVSGSYLLIEIALVGSNLDLIGLVAIYLSQS